jgi:hypothetical protein
MTAHSVSEQLMCYDTTDCADCGPCEDAEWVMSAVERVKMVLEVRDAT